MAERMEMPYTHGNSRVSQRRHCGRDLEHLTLAALQASQELRSCGAIPVGASGIVDRAAMVVCAREGAIGRQDEIEMVEQLEVWADVALYLKLVYQTPGRGTVVQARRCTPVWQTRFGHERCYYQKTRSRIA